MFEQWWRESYPNVKPSTHTVFTHCAFAEYVDQQRTNDVLQQLSRLATDEPEVG